VRSRNSNLRLDRRRRGLPVLPILLGISLLANAWFAMRWEPKGGDGTLTEAVKTLAGQDPAPAPSTGGSSPTVASSVPAEPAPAAPQTGPRLVKVTVDGAIARAFTDALGSDEGSPLAVTAGRLLGWWIDPSKDPRTGDTAAVLYEPNELLPNEILVHALTYTSQKMGKQFEAYHFKPEGWTNATWFDGDGVEVPARINPPVLPDYDQITSLVGDGRGHSGMDFKADVDTPVLSPFAGTVTRTNWNHRFNGNSIEIRSEGRRLRFLHLNHTGVNAGDSIAAGQQIGRSGNTGRSFAPHLHYEIVDGNGKVLNPLTVHTQSRRSVPAEARSAFDSEVARLRTALAQEVAETITPAPADGSP
jgi:murein DD-endopeptidase